MRLEKKITLLVAVGLVIIGAGMVSVSILAADRDFSKLINTVEYEEKTYDITDDFDEIGIEMLSQDLEILRSEDSAAHFICHENDKIKFTVDVSGRKLTITETARHSWRDNIMVNYPDVQDKLYLPKDVYGKFECRIGSGDLDIREKFAFKDMNVKIGSGDAYVEGIEADDIEADSGSGSVTVKELSAGSLGIKVGSGDISTDNVRLNSKITVESMSGDIELTDTISKGSLIASTGSGKIDLTECVSPSMDVKTSSGDISLKSCDGMNLNFKTGSGDVTGSLKTAKSFDAKAGSGDVDVPSDGNGGNCTIRTGSGDIEIRVEN